MSALPIHTVLSDLRDTLAAHPSAVLQAPPGAGKTTVVPLSLLEAPWLGGRKIVMLEPRRLAARGAAHRMAHTLGERVGETVGYRMRLDTKVSAATRIEVVTEGILTRMLHSDPALEGIGLVIFDEFHERSLPADLGLALTLQTQQLFRDDLRLLVMSATLDGARVARLLDDAPVVTSQGRMFPVDTQYLARPLERRIEDEVAAAVRRALRDDTGDVLVFLPGAGEIRRTAERLTDLDGPVTVHPLYGNLPQRAQDAAIAPSPAGTRKVVLATAIAETSLTIEGVRVVVDSGLQRLPRFDPASGMTTLDTKPVSLASADQRRGRAGRLGPGACYRLWTPAQQAHLAPHTAPEIADADLAPLALDLACWGAAPGDLRWLDPPSPAAYADARTLLAELGAINATGAVTSHGRAMAALGLHPRLAHLILQGEALGHGALACDLAALLSERDLLRSRTGPPDADLRLRLDLLQRRDTPSTHHGASVDRAALHRVRQTAGDLRRRRRITTGTPTQPDVAGLLLAFAYPDRMAQQRPEQPDRYRLRSGHAARFGQPQSLSGEPFLTAAHLHTRRGESLIFLAAPLALDDVETHFSDQIETHWPVAWDDARNRVVARRQRRLGAVLLDDVEISDPDADAVADALLGWLAEAGLDVLPWSKNARQFQQRVVFLAAHTDEPDWPDLSDEALRAELGGWLRQHLYGLSRRADVQKLDLLDVLLNRLTWPQRQRLEREAPTHFTAPTGSRRPIDYADPDAPTLAVRLQEMFGETDTPRLAGGRVPLVLHLLSPAQRPVQITTDLAGFWQGSYVDVRKDLRGRYPKHPWPEDPLTAPPTRRTKRKSGG